MEPDDDLSSMAELYDETEVRARELRAMLSDSLKGVDSAELEEATAEIDSLMAEMRRRMAERNRESVQAAARETEEFGPPANPSFGWDEERQQVEAAHEIDLLFRERQVAGMVEAMGTHPARPGVLELLDHCRNRNEFKAVLRSAGSDTSYWRRVLRDLEMGEVRTPRDKTVSEMWEKLEEVK